MAKTRPFDVAEFLDSREMVEAYLAELLSGRNSDIRAKGLVHAVSALIHIEAEARQKRQRALRSKLISKKRS